MNSTVDQIRYTPIIEFLELLRNEGFDVGVDSYLDFYRVLAQMPKELPISSYSSFLAPLVCKNEAEQNLFYELFEAHGQAIIKTYGIKEGSQTNTQEAAFNSPLQDSKEEQEYLVPSILLPKTASKRPEYLKWIVLLSTALICLALLLYPVLSFYSNSTESTPEIEYEDLPITFEEENQVETEGLESTKTKQVEHQAPTKLDYFRDPSKKLDFEFKEVAKPESFPNRVDTDFWYPIYQSSDAIKYGIIFGILLLFLFLQVRQRVNKSDWTKESDSKASFSLGFKIPEVRQWPLEETFQKLAKLLNIRRETDRKELDISKTVSATIKNAGQWDFRFSNQKEVVEYLFLIDKGVSTAHQARFFDQVYQQLKQADVPITRFYYEEIPLLCWNEEYTDAIPLEEIHTAYHKHHLVLCSDGASLVDIETGQFEPIIDRLSDWEFRAIISPKQKDQWSTRELKLSENFHLFPALAEGLASLVQTFEGINTHNNTSWKQYAKQNPRERIFREERLLLDLDEYFSQDLQIWIAACAVYPEVQWDLTMRLGEIVSQHLGKDLLTHENLLTLSNLEWVHKGQIPNEFRAILLNHPLFSIELERKVRAEISRILELNSPDSNAEGYETHQLRLAINELLLQDSYLKSRKWVKIYRRLSRKNIPQDVVSLQGLDKKAYALSDWIPEALKGYVFKEESPTKGITFAMKTTLVSLLCLILLGIRYDYPAYENVRLEEGMVYTVEGADKEQAFYDNFSKHYFNEGLKAYNSDRFYIAKKRWQKSIAYAHFSQLNGGKGAGPGPEQFEALAASYLYTNRDDSLQILSELIEDLNPNYWKTTTPSLFHLRHFDFVDKAHEGMIRVQKDGLYGFLNEQGAIAIPTQYEHALNFHKGKAYVIQQGKQYLINKENQIVEEVTKLEMDGTLSLKKRPEYGLMTDKGTPIMPRHYSHSVYHMSYQHWKVQKDGKYALINTFAQELIPFEYETLEYGNRGLEVRKDGLTFTVDFNNKCLANCPTPEDYKNVLKQKGFKRFLNTHSKKYGYTKASGQVAIPAQFDDAWDFGSAASGRVKKNGKWALIDENQQLLTPYAYDEIKAASEGIYLAIRNQKKGFLNEHGEEISAFSYDFAQPFKGGVALVGFHNPGRYGLINSYGVPITDIQYQFINVWPNGNAELHTGDKTYLINNKGEILNKK